MFVLIMREKKCINKIKDKYIPGNWEGWRKKQVAVVEFD